MSLIMFNKIILEFKAGIIISDLVTSVIFSLFRAKFRIYIEQFKGVRNSWETEDSILFAYF
jgi:hypothetical protein